MRIQIEINFSFISIQIFGVKFDTLSKENIWKVSSIGLHAQLEYKKKKIATKNFFFFFFLYSTQKQKVNRFTVYNMKSYFLHNNTLASLKSYRLLMSLEICIYVCIEKEIFLFPQISLSVDDGSFCCCCWKFKKTWTFLLK
jgi:hypothetical protein